MVKNVLQM